MTISSPINIVFCVNKKYLPYISVVIASILIHSGKDNFFSFYVLSFEDLKIELARLIFSDYRNYKIFNKIVDRSLITTSCHSSYITIDARIRLLIPLILHDIDRCIYLDADLLVNTNIAELYNINLDKYYAAGVNDNFTGFEKFLTGPRYRIINKYELKNGIYINSGVLLFNLKAIREDHAERLLIDTSAKYSDDKDIRTVDQDFVNIALNGKIKTIDPRWNALVYRCYRPPMDCFILHYTSAHKPWNYPVIPAHMLYLENAKISPYYESIKNNLLRTIDEYIAHYQKHQHIYKLFTRMYTTYKLKVFRHIALKMHWIKYQRVIELKDYLTHQTDMPKK